MTSFKLHSDEIRSHGRYRIGCSLGSGDKSQVHTSAKRGKSHEGRSTRKDLTSTYNQEPSKIPLMGFRRSRLNHQGNIPRTRKTFKLFGQAYVFHNDFAYIFLRLLQPRFDPVKGDS